MVQFRSPFSGAVLIVISELSVPVKRLVGLRGFSPVLLFGLVGIPILDRDLVMLMYIGLLVAVSTEAYELLNKKEVKLPSSTAFCGAQCSQCSYFIQGLCPSCLKGDNDVRRTCKIFRCASRKRTICTECDELLDCKTFENEREKCPFGKDLFPLESGLGYVVYEKEPDKSIALFKDYTNRGEYGLLVSRQFPEQMQEKYNLKETSSVWLCTVEGQENWIDPCNLSKLHHVITTFIRRMPRSFVFFEGFEYLMVRNSFLSALKFVQSLMDEALMNKCYFILSINSDAFNSMQLALIRREFEELDY